MRVNRTQDEQIAIKMVSSALKACGHSLVTDETITDRPDWVFDLNGTRIGAECTCVNLERLMKWSNSTRNLKKGKCYTIIFPNEPHFWIKKAVEEKEGKIQSYIKNSRVDEIWLLLHSDLSSPLPLYWCNDNMLNLMSLAASSINPDFDQIWFIHNESGARKLWGKGDAVVPFPELKIEKTYPTIRNRQGMATSTANGVTFSVGDENIEETILIQPLDARYKI